MTRLMLLVVVIVELSASTTAALDRADRRALQGVADALSELRIEDAARDLAPLLRREPNDHTVLQAEARLRFHQGRYAEAVSAMERALANQTPNRDEATLLDLFKSTRRATEAYVESRSEDGRFIVLHAPGRDRHLVSYALRALEGADRALEAELGFRMPGPVRLEIFPTAQTLAAVSTLSVEAIERTGTIALCKWDKLMVTSPRALLRGYPWMDTIAHEYVHLVLTRTSRDRAPVWFQEGVAKFMERRWREPTVQPHLGPAARGLLARALAEDGLIPFDQIHPSIALLPSQEDAALAFAQVSTFIAHFHSTYGGASLRAAVTKIAEGTDARESLAEVAGVEWSALETAWRGSLAGLEPDSPRLLGLRLRRGAADPDESSEVIEAARRSLRLGDLLWARRRFGGAMVQYGRALEAAPGDPILVSRLARAAVAAGEPERALAALEPVAAEYPEHAPTQALLARAKRLLGDAAGARAAAIRAIRLNPFDPSPHCDLAAVASDDSERRDEADRCSALGGENP